MRRTGTSPHDRASDIGHADGPALPHGALCEAPAADDLLRTIASLRATRRFTPRPVDPEDVDRIRHAAPRRPAIPLGRMSPERLRAAQGH